MIVLGAQLSNDDIRLHYPSRQPVCGVPGPKREGETIGQQELAFEWTAFSVSTPRCPRGALVFLVAPCFRIISARLAYLQNVRQWS